MLEIKLIFWYATFLFFCIYFGYPLLLSLISLFRRKQARVEKIPEPTVSSIIAAYNEEVVIGQKIENSLVLDYPKDRLEIIVFSDASTDRTDEIVRSYANRGVKLLRIEGLKGKTYCQNEAAKSAQGEIIVFSDANSMYEPVALKKLVRNFAVPSVGCVVGELCYDPPGKKGSQGVEGESVYWLYKLIIKPLESKVSSLVGGNWTIYAVRKYLFEPLVSEAVGDFVRPIKIVQRGYRVIYEPEAIAREQTAPDIDKELYRRVRMVTQVVYNLVKDKSLWSLLNPWQFDFLPCSSGPTRFCAGFLDYLCCLSLHPL